MLDFVRDIDSNVCTVQKLNPMEGDNMNKTELIQAVAKQADTTQAQAQACVNAVFENVAGSVAQGEQVAIAGFGTFATTERQARMGRNPQTGAEIKIAASTAPKFKAASAFKKAVNNK